MGRRDAGDRRPDKTQDCALRFTEQREFWNDTIEHGRSLMRMKRDEIAPGGDLLEYELIRRLII